MPAYCLQKYSNVGAINCHHHLTDPPVDDCHLASHTHPCPCYSYSTCIYTHSPHLPHTDNHQLVPSYAHVDTIRMHGYLHLSYWRPTRAIPSAHLISNWASLGVCLSVARQCASSHVSPWLRLSGSCLPGATLICES
jgi:hypothetical protein